VPEEQTPSDSAEPKDGKKASAPKKASKPKSEPKAEPKAENGVPESASRFSRTELIHSAKSALHVDPFVAAGALADVKGDGPMTLAQAEKAIDKFLNRKAEV
jgi:hypothetical protein